VSYLWEPDRVLFVGDAAKHMRELTGPFATFTEDPALTRESLARIAGLDFDIAVFGHGRPLTGNAVAAFRELAEREASKA
jgi:glyoxylase-like metal-dependent hydrolase (beta-lactamase superfamily II)